MPRGGQEVFDNSDIGTGYAVGSGGRVVQGASKSTAVTLDKLCGQITMNAASLAATGAGAAGKVVFTLNNSFIGSDDFVDVQIRSGGTANAYRAAVVAVGAGSCAIVVENITAGALAEAVVIGFMVTRSN